MTSKEIPSFNDFVNNQLNTAQRQAVELLNGPVLVIAGAGSGKTRVITARIANLILNHHVPAHAIVALTFTNKAAQEMKERIHQFVHGKDAIPFIGTFHSYCLQLLKKNSDLLDSPFFSILDEDDQRKIVHDILVRNHLEKQINVRQATYYLSQIKNKIDPTLVNSKTLGNIHPFMYDIYSAYEAEKRVSRCYDFDDLLIETVKLLKRNQEFKKELQQQLRHILVDEYQDTNVIQHELLKQLTLDNNTFASNSLCVVGDEDQSIYSWRGATIANIRNFQKDFPATIIIKIEQNYRSVQQILDIANQVISNNNSSNPKNLWSEKKAEDRTKALTCLSEYQESDAISSLLKQLRAAKKGLSSAILYRTHAQSRALEEALIKESIPYRIIGGVQFYERKEIKDLLAYLRLIVNPFDRPSFFRVINTPARGLGNKFEEQAYDLWNQEPFLTFHELIHKLIDTGIITKTKKDAALGFLTAFKDLQALDPSIDALEHILLRIHYMRHIKDEYDTQDAQVRLENIKELQEAFIHFATYGMTSVEQVLQEVALMQDKKAHVSQEDQVLLMTLHSAKGLEFDLVILAGVEEAVLPSARSLRDPEALEEERRLFYVGITRAREYLLLTHARYRYTYGKMQDQSQSRFLREIPARLMPLEDASSWRIDTIRQCLAQWMNIATSQKSYTYKSATISSEIKPRSVVTANFTPSSRWKTNQPVMHEKYGMGVIQNVEIKADNIIYVTAKFRAGVKKIVSTFLQPI
jgi:DNA helicase-2/ATP-dependent DNA helicase PcrA